MGSVFSEYELMQQFKKMVQGSPQELLELSKSMFILLKQKLKSYPLLDVSSTHEKLYHEMINDAIYCEEQNQVRLRLMKFDSLTHYKFYSAIQKVFKLKGSREMRSKFNLTVKGIQFPYSRNKQDFPDVEISGESKSRNQLEVMVSGHSAIILISFFLKPILNQFIKSIDNVQAINLCDEPTIENDSEAKPVEDKQEEMKKDTKTTPTKSNEELYIEDVNLNDTDDDKVPKTDLGTKKSYENVTIEDVTDTEEDELHIADMNKTKPNPCFKDGKELDQSKEEIADERSLDEPEKEKHIDNSSKQCFYCALLKIAENVENLTNAEAVKVNLDCVSRCCIAGNCLDALVGSISALVVSSQIDHTSIQHILQNITLVVENVLDYTKHTRAEFYCKILERLDEVGESEQHRLVTLSRELCVLLIGDDPEVFGRTLKTHRQARRNMIQFMKKTGHYFSLQALIESWNIMYQKGIDIESLLPPFLTSAVRMFHLSPELGSSDYFYFMAEITRNVSKNIVRDQNLLVVEAVKIEFKHGANRIEKQGDLHIYINMVDRIMYQVHEQDGTVTIEEMGLEAGKYNGETKMIHSKHWDFFLPSDTDLEFGTIFNNLSHKGEETDLIDAKSNASLAPASTQSDPTIPEDSENIDKEVFRQFESEINIENSKENFSCFKRLKRKRNSDSGDSVSDSEGDVKSADVDKAFEKKQTIKTTLVIPKQEVMRFWNGKVRNFIRHLIAEEWPLAYGSPCAVVFPYCRPKKYKSRQRLKDFCRIVGNCKICDAQHICTIKKSPFEESVKIKAVIEYKPKNDLILEVTVIGNFELDNEGAPDISKPQHDLNKATGLFLKGKERNFIGQKASKEGIQNVYMEQYDDMNESQIKQGNRSTIKSYDVIKMARQEFEKKEHCGNSFYESVLNVLESQRSDISLNFEETASSKQLPGFVRSVQQVPFKIFMANFDQLKVGANYMNKSETPIIYVDSSGKLLKKEKGKSKLLNTAVVIPPPAVGHTPFPIFEMVSENNKTIDFQTFLEYGWNYLSNAINNEKVCNPKVAVSDFSFANIHSILQVFNQVKIKDYLEVFYQCSVKNKDVPYNTILTICENHALPSFLLFARNLHSEKMIADTFVAGLMKVFEAESLAVALKVFENLAIIHCSKQISKEARENIKELEFNDVANTPGDFVGDFGDDASEEDDRRFGTRKGLRENSPYHKLFKKVIDKVLENNQPTEETSNRFYAPKLVFAMTRQYLSLFPLFSASTLPDKKLTTNSYIELYWKDQRRILKDVPDRLRWPPRYLGELHCKIRRDAKAMITHGHVPNLKHGGKVKPSMKTLFEDYMDGPSKKKSFIPANSKPRKINLNVNESYGGSFERWDSQKSKDAGRKKDNYMKGKNVDHEAIIQSMDVPYESLRITGSKKLLADPKGKAQIPDEIILRHQIIEWLLQKNNYISSEVVDAGLILLDKRLNEDSNMNETVFVYTVQNLRLIMQGSTELVNNGKFLTIIPRDFGLSSYDDRTKALRAGEKEKSAPGSHYTLVSNLRCDPGQVDVYETFEPFRTADCLLTENGKKILKVLTQSEKLQVNAINVKTQDESECGAISVALAVQLCFRPADTDDIHYKMKDVRKELFRCLRENQIGYFTCTKMKIKPDEKILFSMNV